MVSRSVKHVRRNWAISIPCFFLAFLLLIGCNVEHYPADYLGTTWISSDGMILLKIETDGPDLALITTNNQVVELEVDFLHGNRVWFLKPDQEYIGADTILLRGNYHFSVKKLTLVVYIHENNLDIDETIPETIVFTMCDNQEGLSE